MNNEYVGQSSTGGVGVSVPDAKFSETKLVSRCGLGLCDCLAAFLLRQTFSRCPFLHRAEVSSFHEINHVKNY